MAGDTVDPKLAGAPPKTKIENARARGGRAVFYCVAFICLLGAFFCDASVNHWLTEHSSKTLRLVMDWVSKVGDWPAHVGLGLLLLAAAWLRGSKKWQRIFLAMLLACALAGIAARAIKIAVGRPRPSVKSELSNGSDRFHAKYQSFPSGHTASSAAFFGTLFLYRRRIGGPLLLVPLVIAFSRMIVGAHYLSDVVFAATLGLALAGIMVRLLPFDGEGPLLPAAEA